MVGMLEDELCVPSFCSHVLILLAVLDPLLVAMVLVRVQDTYLKTSNPSSGEKNRGNGRFV